MPSAFPKIKPIRYEGAKSKNSLAFKHYNSDEVIGGKNIKAPLLIQLAETDVAEKLSWSSFDRFELTG